MSNEANSPPSSKAAKKIQDRSIEERNTESTTPLQEDESSRPPTSKEKAQMVTKKVWKDDASEESDGSDEDDTSTVNSEGDDQIPRELTMLMVEISIERNDKKCLETQVSMRNGYMVKDDDLRLYWCVDVPSLRNRRTYDTNDPNEFVDPEKSIIDIRIGGVPCMREKVSSTITRGNTWTNISGESNPVVKKIEWYQRSRDDDFNCLDCDILAVLFRLDSISAQIEILGRDAVYDHVRDLSSCWWLVQDNDGNNEIQVIQPYLFGF